MLKSLHIGRYVSDPKDLKVLADFLRAIGFETVADEEGRSAMLSAPLALLSLNSLAKEYSPELRERLKDVNRLLVIEVTNPDTVFEIARKRKFKLLADTNNLKTPKTPETNERSFSLELPGEIVLTIKGRPEEAAAAIEGQLNAAGKSFAIVVSRFNSFITERLLQGTLDGLRRSGAERTRHRACPCPRVVRNPLRRPHPRRNREVRCDHLHWMSAARRYGSLRRDRQRSYARHWAIGAGDWRSSCVCRADLRNPGAGDRSQPG